MVAAPFSDLDEVAAEANNTEYGLGAGKAVSTLL